MIDIKIKKLFDDTIIPKRQKDGDAGFDAYIHGFKYIDRPKKELCVCSYKEIVLRPQQRIICGLGFATEIPKGYYAQIVPRSGLAVWDGLTILNAPGTIDSGYRNEWTAIVVNTSDSVIYLKVGDRICQIIIKKLIDFEFIEVDVLSDSERGLGGFGSTGKN